MMNYKHVLIAVTFLFFSQQAFADCGKYHCLNVKVSTHYVGVNYTLIGTTGNEELLSCTASEGKYLTLDPDEKNYSALYSLLLSSHITQTPVTIRTTETGGCEIKYMVSNL